LWSDGNYIGTVNNCATSEVIQNYIENQGNQEKKAYERMKIFDFE
jgi:REP element-mobilizing transposase RayT